MMQKILLLLSAVLMLSSSSRAQYNDNQAASFNAVNSYIAVPNSPDVSPSTALTLEAWIYPTAYNGNGSAVIAKNFQTFGRENGWKSIPILQILEVCKPCPDSVYLSE